MPAAHAAHVGPAYPALHWHAESAELPASEMKFGGHAVQVLSLVCPVNAEYLPAAQSVQTEASATEYLPAGQAVQVLSLVCPVDAEYLPAEQSVHAAEPVFVL